MELLHQLLPRDMRPPLPEIELLHRLTAPAMRRPWAEVLKRIEGPNDPAGMVFFAVADALRRTRRPQKTRTERAEQYRTIAETAAKLARLIHGSELDETPYRWFPEDIAPNPFTVPRYPTMGAILFAIAEESAEIAQAALTEPRILPRPNIRSPGRIIFIRVLGSFFKDRTGSYLRRSLAAFATAALGEEITPEQVADALRDFVPFHGKTFLDKNHPRATYVAPNDPRLK